MIVSKAGIRARIAEERGSMSSRLGIAAQGLGVAALAALVYFAFLQPSDPDPLSGIEVDGDLPAEVTGGNEQAAAQRGRKPDSRRRSGAGSRPVPRIRLVPVVPGTSAPVPPTVASPTPADPETPAGSQYDSAVARLLGRVGPTPR
jgi:hypothetical protein